MREITEQRQMILRKLRIGYSITVPVLLLAAFFGWGLYLRSTMPARQLMMQLRRAKTAAQIESLMAKSSLRLPDDRMAEVYFNCAVNAFNGKDYDESSALRFMIAQSVGANIVCPHPPQQQYRASIKR